MKFNIMIDAVEKAKRFVQIVSRYGDCDITLRNGSIDAHSIMGVFTLDLSRPIDLNINAEDQRANKFKEDIEQYIIV